MNRGYQFGQFRLDCADRVLSCGGTPVPVSPKTFDALVVFLERAGTLVDRSTLREKLWDGMIVEDANLARVIADARKALGDTGEPRRYIETVPKFGYRLVIPVTVIEGTPKTTTVSAMAPQ